MSYFQLFKPKYAYFILVVNLILFLLTPCFAKAEAIEKCEKYNKAGEGVFNFINNNPQIIRAIIQKVGEMADEYSHAVCQGVDREKAWEMEGNVISQIVTLFVGVGELNALAKAGKGAKLAKALDVATIGCFSKVFHCSSNSKFVKLVGEFMTLECFVAGTQIPTLEGLVNIEDIRIHDFVASVDQKTGIKGFYEVVSLTQSHPTELYHVTYNDAEGDAYTLLTTGEHPFWVSDKGWVAARQLAIADKLSITADTFVTVSSVRYEKAPEGKTFTTYNFEVADTHTYFVLPEGKTDGSFAVWVHNTCQKLWQDHHILSNTHRLTKNHPLLKKAGFDLDDGFNKILLPTKSSLHPTKSIHKGRHLDSVLTNLAGFMDDVYSLGIKKGWSQKKFRNRLNKIINDERDLLESGHRKLNKNTRSWGR